MRRPSWFEPVDSVGEWVGLLGGICVLALIAILIVKGVQGFDGLPSVKSLIGVRRVRFANDLSRPVVLAMCRSDHSAICEHPYERVRIGAGRATVQVTLAGVHAEWAVEDIAGHPLRCVILHWNGHTNSTSVVRLSTAPSWKRPCSRDTEAT